MRRTTALVALLSALALLGSVAAFAALAPGGEVALRQGKVEQFGLTVTGAEFLDGGDISRTFVLRSASSPGLVLDLLPHATSDRPAGNPFDPVSSGVSTVPLERIVKVTALSYGAIDLLPLVGDADGDGVTSTVADLVLRGLFVELPDPFAGTPLNVTLTGEGADVLLHAEDDALTLSFSAKLRLASDPAMSTAETCHGARLAPVVPTLTADCRPPPPGEDKSGCGGGKSDDKGGCGGKGG